MRERTGESREGESGQVTILIASMIVTFILFFAFVTNIGMLVNAKINLQNAADLAAYSGAATQARQLSQISYLNYEMRRQYKKFLFRYYVIGNMAQRGFPRTPGAARAAHKWTPDGTAAADFQVPSVCLIFKPADNFCQVSSVQKVVVPSAGTVPDAIQDTLIAQLKGLESLRQKNCGQIGSSNLQALYLWLYNTDPTLDNLTQPGIGPAALSADQLAVLKIIRGIGDGLGLIPKNLLLRRRIRTLQSYVNALPRAGVTRSTADSLNAANNNSQDERVINAFLSAYQTLGTHTFDSITMDELQPKTVDPKNGPYLNLKDIDVSFDAYFTDLQIAVARAPGGSTVPQDCKLVLIPISVKNTPMGVYKDPKVLTYYPIRLKARAKTLFSPFVNGDLELKAYAAAQPFGSRIGPVVESDADKDTLFRMPRLANPAFTPPDDPLAGARIGSIPNLPITSGDSTATGNGWDSDEVLSALYGELKTPGALGASAQGISLTDLSNAYQAAMAPSPWEKNHYNVPSDSRGSGADTNARFFDQAELYSFWAPIGTPQELGNIPQLLSDELLPLFTDKLNEGGSAGNTNAAKPTQQTKALQDSLITGLKTYVTEMQNPNTNRTELQFQGSQTFFEGANVARLSNPLTQRPTLSSPSAAPISLPSSIFVGNANDLRTSWNGTRGSPSPPGRLGYSVKFIPFSFIRQMTGLLNSETTLTKHPENTPLSDSESSGDMTALQH